MANYWPITNLSTMSKILEGLVLRRLRTHVLVTGNFGEFQSVYRVGHSTETALLKVVNDIVTAVYDQQSIVLLSLDISAAFDTIDHTILLDRARRDFGIHGTALSWIQSFVSDRKQYVAVGNQQSQSADCTSGVPQGSVLRPLLFAMYISRSHQSATSLQHTVFAIISMPTTRSCTWPSDPVPTRTSSHCRCVSKMSLAASWRMDCFSTQPRPKQFSLGHLHSGRRSQQRAALTLLAQSYHSVTS